MRFARGAAAVFALAVALGACGLPTTSPITRGLEVGELQVPPVRLTFEAPRSGASPDEIARGFLAANWSSEDDYEAARTYVTTQAARTWDPRARVTVYRGGGSVRYTSIASDRVRIEGDILGEVDGAGRYTAHPAGATRVSVLRMERVSGQWRISSLPADFGVWLNRDFFGVSHRAVDIAYTEPARRVLVRDRRWFPHEAGLPTAMARAQLAPVPAYLADAAVTGFTRSAALSVDAVPVLGRTAQIDLDAAALDASPENRRAAYAQMLSTMRQVPEISNVLLRIDGAPVDAAGAPLPPRTVADLGYDPPRMAVEHVVVRRGERLHVSSPQSFPDETPTSPRAPTLPTVPADWVDIAVTETLSEVAAVAKDRAALRRWRGPSAAAVPLPGTAFTAPAFDALGHLWVGGTDRSDAARIWVAGPGSAPGAPVALAPGWLSGRQVDAVAPAPDGARLLVVSSRGGRATLHVAGIVRDADGTPRRLAEPWAVGGDVLEGFAPSWVDDTTIALLGRTEETGPVRPLLVTVGGPTESLAAVPDARRILSIGGTLGLILLTDSGSAWSRVSGGWHDLDTVTDAVPAR